MHHAIPYGLGVFLSLWKACVDVCIGMMAPTHHLLFIKREPKFISFGGRLRCLLFVLVCHFCTRQSPSQKNVDTHAVMCGIGKAH